MPHAIGCIFERLYLDHHDWLAGWLRGRLGCSQDAADLAHDTYLRLLGRPRLDRRTLLKSLAVLAVAAPAGWLGHRQLPWREWTADYRTAAGERRDVRLPDASRVLLNTASAVDVDFGSGARRLVLHEGEILVETALDVAQPPRPFVVGWPRAGSGPWAPASSCEPAMTGTPTWPCWSTRWPSGR